jgi:hypothetical protein
MKMKNEIIGVENQEALDNEVLELDELQLALIGGGSGETILH